LPEDGASALAGKRQLPFLWTIRSRHSTARQQAACQILRALGADPGDPVSNPALKAAGEAELK
jgi:hypothetical protein